MVKKIRLIGDKTTNLFCMNLKQYFNFIGTYVEIDYVYDYIYKNNFIDKELLNDLFIITDNKENNINIEYDLVISTIKNTGSDIYIIEDSINQIKYNYEEDINIILSLLFFFLHDFVLTASRKISFSIRLSPTTIYSPSSSYCLTKKALLYNVATLFCTVK